ncbi:MAG: transposase [Thermoproteota archaeon]|nr:MAG: transposase [Candidatus Korarchaeota archaeon]
MDSGSTLVRSRKIRIYPKASDVALFNKYLGLSRYWYNQAIEHLKKPGTKASLYEVRKIQKNAHPEWAFACPQRIREHSINEACKAVKNGKSKFKQTGQFQEIHFRRKKDVKQRFGFDKQSLKSSSVFRGKRSAGFYSSEKFVVSKEGTKIVRENNRWFVVLPRIVNVKKPENQRLGVVSLDPGVRTFQTYFSPFAFGKIGVGNFSRIFKLCLRLDKLYSKMTKADYRGKRRLSKASKRLRWKIKDLISDLHKKTAYFLVTNFDKILIPYFETQKMVSKLRSKTARSMLNYAHFRFKSFLQAKAEEYSCQVIEVSEAYTSRVCSFCGKEQNIGSKPTLKCTCGKIIDRDLNGARGIFLKNTSLAVGAYPLVRAI